MPKPISGKASEYTEITTRRTEMYVIDAGIIKFPLEHVHNAKRKNELTFSMDI